MVSPQNTGNDNNEKIVILPPINEATILSYFVPGPPPIPETLRTILEDYSKIPHHDVESHLITIRTKAWAVRKYPCIGRWHFLRLTLPSFPQWDEILQRVQRHEKFLEVGAFLGAETRVLASSPGVSSQDLYALDLFPEYLKLGFDLFRDADRLPRDHFIGADLFDEGNERVKLLEGRMGFVFAGAFLHLFTLSRMCEALYRFVRLLRPEAGVLVLGRLLGRDKPGETMHEGMEQTRTYKHNSTTFRKMWEDVGLMTGSKWELWIEEAELNSNEGATGRDVWAPEGSLVLRFCARRVE